MASNSKKASNPVALGSISLPRRQLSYRYVINDAEIFLDKKGSEGLRSPNFSIVLPKNSESVNQLQTSVWHLQVYNSKTYPNSEEHHRHKIKKTGSYFAQAAVYSGSSYQAEPNIDKLFIHLHQGSREGGKGKAASTSRPSATNPPLWREEGRSRILVTNCEFQIINSETGEILFTKASESGSCLERNVSNESPGSCGNICVKYADINKFLYRGALTIQVEATLLCLTEPTECTHQQKPLENNVLAANKSLFEDKQFADVTIKCGDAEFKAHKAILASQSPVFKKMLESDMKEQRTNVIEISDVDQAVISDMLAYLYTGSAPHMDTLVKELLNVANKYELPQLFQMCEDKLKSKMKISNVFEILILADMHNASHLKDACLNYIRHNSAAVRSSSQWKELKKNCDSHASLLVEIMDFILQ